MPSPPPDAADLLSPRQRWLAARALAADESDRVAAGAAEVRVADLRAMRDADPEFDRLVDDFRTIQALPLADRIDRLQRLCLDGAERAILDGRVSTLNQCMRALRLLEGAEEGPEDRVQTFYDGLSDEEYAEMQELDARWARSQNRARGKDETPPPPPSPIPGGTGEGARGEPPAAVSAPSPVRSMGEGRGEGGPSATALSTGTVPLPTDPALCCPPNLREPGPRGPGPADPFPWPADPAGALNAPRPDPNGPTVPRPPVVLRRAREPVPPWISRPPPPL